MKTINLFELGKMYREIKYEATTIDQNDSAAIEALKSKIAVYTELVNAFAGSDLKPKPISMYEVI